MGFQWKMSLNHDPTKQVQEVVFSRKTTKKIHLKMFFNNIPVNKADSQKHLGLHLDSKLYFDIHIKAILTKVNRTLSLLRKFHQLLPRPSLITIYKAFIRPHLNYGDVIFDQAFNNSFHQRLESIQCNAVLAITEARKVGRAIGQISNLAGSALCQSSGNSDNVCYVWGLPQIYKVTLFIFHRNRYTYLKVQSNYSHSQNI